MEYKKRRNMKEISKEIREINKRKPSEDELVDLVKIINENSLPDKEEQVEDIQRIAIKREDNGIEQTRV